MYGEELYVRRIGIKPKRASMLSIVAIDIITIWM
jgi:hypothetical protein